MVAHINQFKADTILTAWQLHQHLASGHSDLKGLALPSREVMRKCTIRLGYLDLLWQRELHKCRGFCRVLRAGASPQGGFNFYAVLEDRVSWELVGAASGRGDFRDCAGSLERRHYSLSMLGCGSADTTMNRLNTQHMCMP